MKKVLILILMISISLSGCWDQRIYEQTGFILNFAVEESEKDGKLLITVTIPAIGAKEKYGIEMITTTADALREGRENVNRMSSRRALGGKTQQILFSEGIAKKGIAKLLEVVARNPELPQIAWVAVVEGSPREMLEKSSKFKDIPGPAVYINQLILNNARDSFVPETRVYDFNINYFAQGTDPIVPLLKLEPKKIQAAGSAVFSGDVMVGKLDHDQTAVLIGMMGRTREAAYSYTAPFPQGMSPDGKKEFSTTFLQPKRKVNINLKNGMPEVSITLSYDGYIEEFGWDDLSSSQVQKKIESHLSSMLKKDCTETLKYLQQVGSDPIGIGEIVRANYYNYWQGISWKDIYSDIDIKVDVKVDIKRYGAID